MYLVVKFTQSYFHSILVFHGEITRQFRTMAVMTRCRKTRCTLRVAMLCPIGFFISVITVNSQKLLNE